MVRLVSKQPRKQRKARYTAPSHIRTKYLNAPLSDALKEKYKIKTLRVVKGDTVKVTRGDFVGDEGLIDGVDTKNSKLIIHGISSTKARWNGSTPACRCLECPADQTQSH